MLRIQYHRYGGPEELRLEDVPLPDPGPGALREKVKAAGSNPADWVVRSGATKLVSGAQFPRGLGHDFAGVVDAVGPNVSRFKVGDEVYGISMMRAAGAFAEYLVVPEKHAYRKPTGVSFEIAAAVPMAGVTAWSAVVDKAKVTAGQSLFITGCLGGIGRAAVQFARMRGAEVYGNCSASARDEAVALGVKEAFDYKTFDVNAFRQRFDAVMDPAGALSFEQMRTMIKPAGVAVLVVLSPRKILGALLKPYAKIASGNPTAKGMQGITQAIESGKFVPKIAETVSLADAIPILVKLETTGVPKGKVVLVP